MPINFPDSPSNGQVYTVGNRSWQWSTVTSTWDSITVSPAIQGIQGVQGISNTIANVNTVFTAPLEKITISAAAATGTISFDVITQSVLYYTVNSTANFTLNFRGNSSTSLDSLMSTGQAVTCVFLNTNGSAAYYPSVINIDGTSITPEWQGGIAVTNGNINSIDAYTYTIIKTDISTYVVLAMQAKFA